MHTYPTHDYLLRAEEQLQCETCKCSLSVKHILLNCVVFSDSGRKCFGVDSLKELFHTFWSCTILGFLQEIELYQKFSVRTCIVYDTFKILEFWRFISTFE